MLPKQSLQLAVGGMRICANQWARKRRFVESGKSADGTAALLRSASEFGNPRDLLADFDFRGRLA